METSRHNSVEKYRFRKPTINPVLNSNSGARTIRMETDAPIVPMMAGHYGTSALDRIHESREQTSTVDESSLDSVAEAGLIAPASAEDDELCKPRELWGWYASGVALNTYFAINNFLPLLAQSCALVVSGFPEVCQNIITDPISIAAVFRPVPGYPNVTSMYYIANFPGIDCDDPLYPECVGDYCRGVPSSTSFCRLSDGSTIQPLRAGGVDPTSFVTVSIAIATFAQVIAFVCVGAAADYGSMRKRILVFSSYLGAFTIACCTGITPATWWLSAPLAVIATVCGGVSNVMQNAYLPLLSRSQPDVLAHPPGKLKTEEGYKFMNILSTRVSMLNNVGAVLAIILSVPWGFFLSEIPSYQIPMAICAVLWSVFMIPTVLWLRRRPGPSIPANVSLLRKSLTGTLQTVRDVFKLPQSAWYLLWWMVGSDAMYLIGTIGGLFANSEIAWGCFPKAFGILSLFLLAPLCGIGGNFVYLTASRRFGWSPITTLVVSMLMTMLVPLYALVGFVSTTVGVRQGWEIIVIACWYGFNFGGYLAFSLSVFSSLVPPGHESRFFAIYELTNSGSSAFGPLVLAGIQQATGEIRYGFIFVVISICVAAMGVSMLNLQKGRAEAKAYVESETVGGEPTQSTDISSSEADNSALIPRLQSCRDGPDYEPPTQNSPASELWSATLPEVEISLEHAAYHVSEKPGMPLAEGHT